MQVETKHFTFILIGFIRSTINCFVVILETQMIIFISKIVSLNHFRLKITKFALPINCLLWLGDREMIKISIGARKCSQKKLVVQHGDDYFFALSLVRSIRFV